MRAPSFFANFPIQSFIAKGGSYAIEDRKTDRFIGR